MTLGRFVLFPLVEGQVHQSRERHSRRESEVRGSCISHGGLYSCMRFSASVALHCIVDEIIIQEKWILNQVQDESTS